MTVKPRRLALANLPTPVLPLSGKELIPGKKLYLWRDDLTEFIGSGNKIRKLEYLLADAEDSKATHIVTCGGPQSNHARATVVMARKLGLPTTVVVREPPTGPDAINPKTGNLFINQLAGTNVRYVPYSIYQEAGGSYDKFLAEEADRIKAEGGTPYIIPEGGSCPLGCWGYLNAAVELSQSWLKLGTQTIFPDHIFIALGSGGTHVGLHLGLEQLGVDTGRLTAVNVCDDEPYFQKRCGDLLQQTRKQYGLTGVSDKLQIADGHVGTGYAEASKEDLQFYKQLFQDSGVLLDPCYTGKAFQGMLHEVKKNPEQYGEHILFLHSGGIFANFAYADQFLN